MKRLNNILWGIVLVTVGVVLALNILGLTEINVFFKGWWTLFIIVPCAIGLFTAKEKAANLIGIAVGVALLLASRGIIDYKMIWKLALPAAIVIIGLSLIFKDSFDKTARKALKELNKNNTELKQCCAVFSGQNINYDNEPFDGVELTAVFGGVKCDLRNAVFTSDAIIRVCSVFGGVDILLPDTVNVKMSSTSIFGGMSDKRSSKPSDKAITLYVTGECIFGGAELK